MVMENIADLSARLRMPAISAGTVPGAAGGVRPDSLLGSRAPHLRRAARRRRRGFGGARRPVRPRHPGLDRGAPGRAVPLPPGKPRRRGGLSCAAGDRVARHGRGFEKSFGQYLYRRRAGNFLRSRRGSGQHGGQAGELDPVRRAQGRRERRAPRVDRERPVDQVPHRRRAHRGRVDAGHRARRAGDLAHQGDVGARHRRAPRAAGRPLQGARATAATSTFASRSCRACTARTRCCGFSIAAR